MSVVVYVPSLGEVGPVGDEVFGNVTVAGPVAQGCGEGLPEQVLQVVSMVSTHPAGVGTQQASHAVWLREQVGVGTAGSLMGQWRENIF